MGTYQVLELTKASKAAIQRVDSNSEDLLGVLSHLSPLKLGSGFVSSAGGKVSYFSGVSPTLKWDGSLPVHTLSLSPSLSVHFILKSKLLSISGVPG